MNVIAASHLNLKHLIPCLVKVIPVSLLSSIHAVPSVCLSVYVLYQRHRLYVHIMDLDGNASS